MDSWIEGTSGREDPYAICSAAQSPRLSNAHPWRVFSIHSQHGPETIGVLSLRDRAARSVSDSP